MMTTPSAMRGRLLSGGAWALAGRIGLALGALALNALLARLLTPDDLGAYFLAYSVVTVSAMAAQLGMNQSVVKLIAESVGSGQPGRAGQAVAAAFGVVSVGVLLVGGAFLAGGWAWLAEHVFSSQTMAGVALLAVLWTGAVAFQGLFGESFRGLHDIRFATLFGGLFSTLSSVGLFAALWVGRGHTELGQVVLLSVGAGLANAVLAASVLYRRTRALTGVGRLARRDLLQLAWPLLLTNLILFALTNASLWIVGAFRSADEVAVYGAAARLVLLVAMPLTIVNAVMPPLVAELYAQRRNAELERALRTTAAVAGIPALVVLLVFVAFGRPVLSAVFGAFYADGAPLLALLSLGQLVNVWAGSCGLTLMMTGHQVTMLGISVFGGLLTVTGSLAVVRPWGPTGVAAVAAAALATQNLLMVLYAKRATGMWTHAAFLTLARAPRT